MELVLKYHNGKEIIYNNVLTVHIECTTLYVSRETSNSTIIHEQFYLFDFAEIDFKGE